MTPWDGSEAKVRGTEIFVPNCSWDSSPASRRFPRTSWEALTHISPQERPTQGTRRISRHSAHRLADDSKFEFPARNSSSLVWRKTQPNGSR